MDEAYRLAIEEYESMEGLHGLRTIDDIMQEENCDYEEAEQLYYDERESWLDYKIKKVAD